MMNMGEFPWVPLAILTPLVGALWVRIANDGVGARWRAAAAGVLALGLSCGGWIDFSVREAAGESAVARSPQWFSLGGLVGIDPLNAPLLPLAALVYLVTVMATQGAKQDRLSFPRTLVSESIVLATLACQASWLLVLLLAAATVPPWMEMRARGRSTRVYELHMGLFIGLMVLGWAWHSLATQAGEVALGPASLLAAALLLRSGIVPLHCWITDLFEKATFGTALLFVVPLTGAYAVMRMVLPIAPTGALQSIALVSLFTAVYAAGMALVQREARRFFCYLFLSHASLVLVGLELVTPLGLTGALCVWLSVGLSLTGFGITLRCVEARIGRVALVDFHGLYKQMPSLAAFFLLTGLASIGFPATVGFVGMELLVEGAVGVYPLIGSMVVITAALNGIAVVHAYFRIFTGRRHVPSFPLFATPSERVAVLVLSLLILGGGLVPQPGMLSRYRAAQYLTQQRQLNTIGPPASSVAVLESERSR